MKQFFLVFIGSFLISFSVNAQQSVKHTVAKGETVTQIAQKYKVTPLDIFTLNPDARNGVKENTVLLIPAKGKTVNIPAKETKPVENNISKNAKNHVVEPKETVYGLAKQYNISIAELEKANPEIKDGLKIGQTLVIPVRGATAPSVKANTEKDTSKTKKEGSNGKFEGGSITHEVAPRETKYSISKQYGITIEELENKNPEAKEGLKIGQKLLIKGNLSQAEIVPQKDGLTEYIIKPKETLYSLSKQFSISQSELIDLNPQLQNGVQIGMTIKVPSAVSSPLVTQKDFIDLTKSLNTSNRKELVLLLPFNVSKIQSDTASSIQQRLKNDNFLNMTLDFYSGALMAIDSAKTLGLNINVKILDSQENKNTSAISSSFVNANLINADVVVGPFYQSHAEKTAQLLNTKNIPVISPLSKDNSMIYTNLYQSVPTVNHLKNAMFEYMNQRSSNIIAVVDPKKGSVKKYITENYPSVKFATFTDKGGVSAENLKGLLLPNQMNYVIMETANTWMIKTTITTLLEAQKNYQVQLVILESNETLNSDEIQISNLGKLKMLYPSVTRENETPEASIFSRVYKKKNNIFPNQYATRGFDVTFDTMLRLSQEKSFEETIYDASTEQVENKFNYTINPAGGYSNGGVYILYYDEDLTVKEAK